MSHSTFSPLAAGDCAALPAGDVAKLRAEPQAVRSTGHERLAGFDIARAIAAIAVVWLHSAQSAELSRYNNAWKFGTALMGFMAAYFLVQSVRHRPYQLVASHVGTRFRRLMVPFALWCLIALLPGFIRAISGRSELPSVPISALWLGTTYHLWFLPFIFVISALSIPLVFQIIRAPHLARPAAVVLAGIGLTICVLRPLPVDHFSSQSPFHEVLIHRAPSFLWGLAFALWWLHVDRFRVFWAGATTAIVIAAALIALCIGGNVNLMLTHRIAAFALAIAAFAPWRGELPRLLGLLGKLSFGIYLIHPFIIAALNKLLGMAGMPEGPWHDVVVFAVTLPTTAALTLVIRRTQYTRWAVP